MNETQVKRLTQLAEVLKEGDFALLKHFTQLEDRVDGVEGVAQKANVKAEQAISIAEETQKMEGPKGKDGEKGEPGRDGSNGRDGKNGVDGKDGKDGRNGINGTNGKDGKNGENGKDGSPDTPEQIIEKVNEAEGLINKERVEGLMEMERNLKREISSIPRGMAPRRVFQPKRDDLSASCNGSTKIFYLARTPLDDATVMVYGTDFPVILRPTIDFTIVGKKLTLTSAVPTPSNGATLIVTYFS